MVERYCTRIPRADFGVKTQLYRGYDAEDELSLNGCIFRAAQHFRLVSPGETGFGWNNAQICDLSDRIRVSIEYETSVLDQLPQDVRSKLSDGLNLSPA